MIELDKKTGINLKKGSKISLLKEQKKLEKVCIGMDWGMIKKKTLGIFTTNEAVDLDASVVMFDSEKRKLDTVYFKRLFSTDGAVRHSGDDRVGDAQSDGLDNEVITVVLNKLNPKIQTLVFFLNSYKGQEFNTIPYSKIRIYEGTRREVYSVFATFNLSAEEQFKGKTSMIMGKFNREADGNWSFVALGEASSTKDLNETVEEIRANYL